MDDSRYLDSWEHREWMECWENKRWFYRIGLACAGFVGVDDGDVFGDVVSVAQVGSLSF